MKTPIRTDMHCTQCRKVFIAQLDVGLDGNHVVECPYCGHEHCRVIENGVVTGERWDSRMQRHDAVARRVWKPDSQPMITSMAALYLHDAWLNRVDVDV